MLLISAVNLNSHFSKEIEDTLDTEIEYKIQYFNYSWVQALINYIVGGGKKGSGSNVSSVLMCQNKNIMSKIDKLRKKI